MFCTISQSSQLCQDQAWGSHLEKQKKDIGMMQALIEACAGL
jgi:hypothetical protein